MQINRTNEQYIKIIILGVLMVIAGYFFINKFLKNNSFFSVLNNQQNSSFFDLSSLKKQNTDPLDVDFFKNKNFQEFVYIEENQNQQISQPGNQNPFK